MKLVALTFVSALVSGCFCSAATGQGDTVFARGTDQLVLCSNDGFVATISGSDIEGRLEHDGSGVEIGVEGDDSQQVFSFTDMAGDFDGFGSGWTEVDQGYTEAERDHADVLCSDLTSRSWWPAS